MYLCRRRHRKKYISQALPLGGRHKRRSRERGIEAIVQRCTGLVAVERIRGRVNGLSETNPRACCSWPPLVLSLYLGGQTRFVKLDFGLRSAGEYVTRGRVGKRVGLHDSY